MTEKCPRSCSHAALLFLLGYLAVLLAIWALWNDTAVPRSKSPDEYSVRPEKLVVYQIQVDRFFDGGVSNSNVDFPVDLLEFQGGNINGITEKLDYLQDLGVNVLMLSPVNASDTPDGLLPQDIKSIDTRYGSLADLRLLILEAHRRQMKILLTLVLHQLSESSVYPEEFLESSIFPVVGINDSYPWQTRTRINFGNGRALKLSKPDVYKYVLETARFWIDQGIDGFHLTAASLIQPYFWEHFRKDVKAYAGERFVLAAALYLRSAERMAPYAGSFDYVFDYHLQRLLEQVYTGKADPSDILMALEHRETPGKNTFQYFNIFDHDLGSRFMSYVQVPGDAKTTDALKQALTFLFTTPGAPVLLYGTEIALENTPMLPKDADHRSRSPMSFDENKNHPVYEHIQKIAQIRQFIDFDTVARKDISSISMGGVYATFMRDVKGNVVLVLHNMTAKRKGIPFDLGNLVALPDGVLVDLLTEEGVKVKSGVADVLLEPYQSRVLSSRKVFDLP